ncbi:MAG: hypothetical protein QME45_14570 [Clostridiales bacterium]|nr:hypothetical protein [Clostridiales bacterium]
MPHSVFNGIISVYNEFKTAMSASFPERCPDNGMIVGFDEKVFRDSILSLIPDFKLSDHGWITTINEYTEFDQYALLDFIEFCMENIKDYEQKDYHGYFSHYHFNFDTKGTKNKTMFCDKINRIFQRNGIAFNLTENGEIRRVLPVELDRIIKKYCNKGSDIELNKLIDLAIKNIVKPKIDDRQVALEKIWDAFERIKTYHLGVDKKASVMALITSASENSTEFYNLLDTELKTLTIIGNRFRIRHHETDKIKISSVKHIDYLFYRMMSLISMLINYL